MMHKEAGFLKTFQEKAVKTTITILELNIFRDPLAAGLALKYLKDFLKKLEKED